MASKLLYLGDMRVPYHKTLPPLISENAMKHRNLITGILIDLERVELHVTVKVSTAVVSVGQHNFNVCHVGCRGKEALYTVTANGETWLERESIECVLGFFDGVAMAEQS